MSNEKLREKYDREQGINLQEEVVQSKNKGEFRGRPGELEKEYNRTKSAVSEVLGDKATRLQGKILTIFAIGAFIGTLLIIFKEDPSKKRKTPGFSKEHFERQFNTTFKGRVS